jgi:hypothetical protein
MPKPTISLPKLPVIRVPAAMPRGPRLYDIKTEHAGGPGEVPAGFLGNRNSAVEWLAYWGLAKAFTNPVDPRQGPFDGGYPDWTYQEPDQAGAGLRGSVVDFVVYNPGRGARPIAIRVQTEHFHLFTDAETQAYDSVQRTQLEQYADVIDVYDYDLVGDPTGAKSVVTMKRAAALLESANPITAGTAIRASRVARGS